ncbi:MAG: antibiotic biosynthesis monooxygenase [Vicinamibacteria bacterium]
MIHIVWEFVVKPDCVEAFDRAYGPDGDWARLFAAYPGYQGTSLLRDSLNPRRFVTIDRWETMRHRSDMLHGTRDEYERLDAEFELWTESEREVGTFS